MLKMTVYTPPSESPSELSKSELGKMQLIYFSNEFPNDDLQTLLRRLHTHNKDKQHAILATFIEEATTAVREEVAQLSPEIKSLVPAFETILNLGDFPELRKGPLSGSVDGILLCVVELAALIGYYENNPTEFLFDGISTCVSGLGIGLLASAALSISPTLAEVPKAGAEVVRLAFRLGVLVDEVSSNLEPRDSSESPDPWAYVIPDVNANEVQSELDKIRSRNDVPESSKIFISALSPTSVTISGPPSRLKALFKNEDYFREQKFIALPVYGGLCHAKHIYTKNHVQKIVDVSTLDALNRKFPPMLRVLSTSTGRAYTARSAKELFEQIIWELLAEAIQWDKVIQGVIGQATDIEASICHITLFRISLPVRDLIAALKSSAQSIETSTQELIPWISEITTDRNSPRSAMQSKLAIVGMSCRLPGGATDTEKFWQLLEQGLDVSRKIPADRFDVETHCDPTGKRMNTSQTEYGCFIDEPGLFDAPFFNMSPKEAAQTDPQQRLALVTAYEALEQAGYVPNRTASTKLDRIGTFYGQAADDYREVNQGQEVSTYYIPGGCRAFGPGRINYFFKFSGPSFNVDTACSSSLAAIQAACTSLWAGDADTVVAGGVNVLTNSDGFAGLSHGHFLTKTHNACKTWDENADGYCRADAIGSIVIKRLEDAEADNDNVLGVILAAATNHSAEAISITHPHAGAQSFLYSQVVNRAGVDPLDVSFVEMHGTGTQAGDKIEIESVTNVFAPPARRRSSKQPLYLGAVKSNVGHSESGAGVTALIKVLLMLEKEAIPKHVGIKTGLNPGFPKDLEKRNVRIPYEQQPWSKSAGKKRVAVVNNFSAAGGNTTLVLEEGPVRERFGGDGRDNHVIGISAKSKVSLKGNLKRFMAYLDSNPDVLLSDLSYTTMARKYHHNHRVAISASTASDLKKKLTSALSAVDSHKPIAPTGPPTIAFTFTGQGSSYKSMNLELYHDSPFFRNQIHHLDVLAQGQGFPSFIPAIDGSHERDYAHSPVVTQLALVCIEIALAKYWASLGIKPNVVVGHSLGEYAAMHVAGVLSASDAIFLVGRRAQLLEKKCQMYTHKMMAVRAALIDIQEVAGDKPYEVACINGPKETVLSGTQEEMEAISELLQAQGHRCTLLDVAFAFHSAQTDPILDEFEEIAKNGALFQTPKLPIISPLLSKVVFDGKTVNASYVRRATREPVNFLAALDIAQKFAAVDEKTIFVEIGPHPVCAGFVKAIMPSVGASVASLRRGENAWTTLANSLCTLHCSGITIDWNEYHRPFEAAHRLLSLPTYSWNDKTHWLQYNGDWNLTKGNTFYDEEKGIKARIGAPVVSKSDLRTSTVQTIVEENFTGMAAKVVMQSDLMQSDFLEAANGHRMNGCGVVTSSIHADIAFTLGHYIHKKLKPNTKDVNINVANLEVLHGLIAQKNTKTPQVIQVSAETEDINSGIVDLKWHNVNPDGSVQQPFASANIYYGDSGNWLKSWVPAIHLVQGRIEALEQLAKEGVANRFSHTMAYRLFGQNLVDYAKKYRGMQSVIMNQFEAVADVTLTTESSGNWTVPPYFIDSVCHLAGFVMNVSDAMDTEKNYCVTPGWRTMRFARPLIAGNRYRSYVKMIPTLEDATIFFGDVYIFQDNAIVGMVEGIQFRQYPRILLNRFFSAPDEKKQNTQNTANASSTKTPALKSDAPSKPKPEPSTKLVSAEPEDVKPTKESTSSTKPVENVVTTAMKEADENSDSIASRAMALIAKEAALEITDLADDASFSNLGVDSLMSLVIAEKFREELGVTVGGGLFLEYPTIGDLRAWLEEYYS